MLEHELLERATLDDMINYLALRNRTGKAQEKQRLKDSQG